MLVQSAPPHGAIARAAHETKSKTLSSSQISVAQGSHGAGSLFRRPVQPEHRRTAAGHQGGNRPGPFEALLQARERGVAKENDRLKIVDRRLATPPVPRLRLETNYFIFL
jgi:hypothetical protein